MQAQHGAWQARPVSSSGPEVMSGVRSPGNWRRKAAEVFLSGRRKPRVHELAKAISRRGEEASAAEGDALDEGAVNSHIDDVVATAGRI
jgi:hypothetical protein